MKALVCVTAVLVGLVCSAPAPGEAATIVLSRADWEAANPGFADVDLSGIPEYDMVGAIDLPFGQALAFDSDLERLQVPSSWATWSEGHEPELLYTISGFSVTATFLSPLTGGFGFEVQPDLFGAFPIALSLSDGTTMTLNVDGFGDAAFFGWYGTGIESFTVSCVDCGFAIGRMAVAADVAAIPEPATLTLTGSAIVLWSLARRRRSG